MDSIVVVMTTVQTEADAEKLATALLERHMAACVQIDGPVVSHYRWQGVLERATEYRLMIKLAQSKWSALSVTLAELHPYDEPEIIRLAVVDASEGYRKWVLDQCR